MANNEGDGLGDDFFEQILSVPSSFTGPGAGGYVPNAGDSPAMRLQLGSGYRGLGLPPLGLNLDHLHTGGPTTTLIDSSASSAAATNDRDFMHLTSMFPNSFGEPQSQSIRLPTPTPTAHLHQTFQSQAAPRSVTNPSARPRVRARRGQATDPHSIAERLRRERISERMKALQELVPSCNKTDKAAMLDEILDYVKFLRLQVKVLSMSRLGGAGAIAQLVSDKPLSLIEGEGEMKEGWEKWSDEGTEEEVAKLMEVDIGAAMQFLQSKTLCLMPLPLATAISRSNQSSFIKPESNSVS